MPTPSSGGCSARSKCRDNTEMIPTTRAVLLLLIAAPVIATAVGSFNIMGTACPGCTVEIFENGDADGEGESYVGQAIANTSGDFGVTVGTLLVPYLTATATDSVSGTSEFSAVAGPRSSNASALRLRMRT